MALLFGARVLAQVTNMLNSKLAPNKDHALANSIAAELFVPFSHLLFQLAPNKNYAFANSIAAELFVLLSCSCLFHTCCFSSLLTQHPLGFLCGLAMGKKPAVLKDRFDLAVYVEQSFD